MKKEKGVFMKHQYKHKINHEVNVGIMSIARLCSIQCQSVVFHVSQCFAVDRRLLCYTSNRLLVSSL